jgi:hypothetical protein
MSAAFRPVFAVAKDVVAEGSGVPHATPAQWPSWRSTPDGIFGNAMVDEYLVLP